MRDDDVADGDGARPEFDSPGCHAYWRRTGARRWEADYEGRRLVVLRSSSRSPTLAGYIDEVKVFARVRFPPVAKQRCEALVRLGRAPAVQTDTAAAMCGSGA